MRASVLLAVFMMFQCVNGRCADPSALFPNLARLDLKDARVRVWYPKAMAHALTSPPAYLKEYDKAGVYAAEPLVLELGHGLPKLAIACDSGPSNDPSCRLLTNFEDPASGIFESAGNDFVFLPSAEIYVFGDTDQLYDHRRLFRFDGTRFKEVAQPFRYVGIEGKTKAPLALTGVRGGGTNATLVTLARDTPIAILLNVAGEDDENGQNAEYLVKTREGLVGWAHIPVQPDGTTIVEGFRFAGD